MFLSRVVSVLLLLIAIAVILIYGQDLLIPFVFALLIWFLVMKVRSLLDRISWVKRKLPRWFRSLLTSLVIFGILGAMTSMLTNSINSLAQSYPKYESNVDLMSKQIGDLLQINIQSTIGDYLADFDFGSLLKSVISSISSIIGNAFMILIYLVFVFLEANSFSVKLEAMCKSKEQFEQVKGIISEIEKSITHYIGLKTLVSFITGALSYFVLLMVGVDSPFFWSFLIFLLNFIPNIGSIVGTLFPAIFSLLQFAEIQPFLIILIFVGGIQVLVGNVLEPKLMGNSLNISALVTLLALSFWGAIWGITGMFLSVPITVMMVIVFAQFPSTRPVAIMLSEKGKV